MSKTVKSIYLALTFILIFSSNAFTETRYLKSSATGWFNNDAWSATSSSGTDNATVPTANDMVYIGNSSNTVLVSQDAVCLGIILEATFSGTLSLTSACYRFDVGTSGFQILGGNLFTNGADMSFNIIKVDGSFIFNKSGSTVTIRKFQLVVINFTVTSGNFILGYNGKLKILNSSSIANNTFTEDGLAYVEFLGANINNVFGKFSHLKITSTLRQITINDITLAENPGYSINILDNPSPSGTATITSGAVVFTYPSNQYGLSSFSYGIYENGRVVKTVFVDVVITSKPLANPDTFTINEDSGNYTFYPTSNDSNANGSFQITKVSSPSKGVVSFGPNSIIYTPLTNHNGSDVFTYTITSSYGLTAIGTISATLTPVNDAPVAVTDSFATNEDTAYSFNSTTNDTDVDGNTLTIIAKTNGSKGIVSYTGNVVTYTPNLNANGSDSFTYTISDGNGGTAVGTVNVTITAVNDAPVAVTDSFTRSEDSSAYTFNPTTNDTDVEGNALTITAKTNGSKGTVTYAGNNVTYTPNLNANGSDSFTYTISDGNGGTAVGTVNVTLTPVNDAPVAVTDSFTTNEDTAYSFNSTTNDTDVDGNTLSITAKTNGSKGTVSYSGNTVTYTPNLNANGSDSFTYTISDGNGGTAVGTVNVTITAVNDAPVAVTDSFTRSEDSSAYTFNPTTNDTDVEGNALTITAKTNGSKGTVTYAGNNVTYTPNLNANGSDSFTYTISDGNGGTAVGTVNVTLTPVNDAPIAISDSITTNEDSSISFNPTTNDTDIEGNALTITATTNGTKGIATFSGNNVTYTPNLNANGSDSFTYTISDGNGDTAVGAVNVTLTPVNDAPIAISDSITTNEDSSISFNPTTNDTDIEGDTLTITATTNGTKGSATYSGNNVTYTPNADATGSDSFTYTISDGNGGSAVGTVNVTILAVNSNPVAVNDSVVVIQNTAYTFNPTLNDTDIDGNTLSITANTNGTKGTVTFTTSSITYTPNINALGSDSFTYTISDGNGGSATGAISVTIVATGTARFFKTGATSYNSANSWSVSGPSGVDNAGIPGATHVAIFDTTAGNCTVNVASSVAGIVINSGYTGTITQGAFSVTVGASGFSQSGGIWNSSASAITFNGPFNLLAGTFNAPTGTLTLANTLTIAPNTFNPSTGTVAITAATVTLANINFYNLTLNNSSQIVTVASNTIVNNTLTTSALATINGSPIEAKGNLVFTDTSWNGSSKIIVNGTGTQTTSGSGVCGVVLEVNKASGVVNLGANLTLLGASVDLNLVAGTVNANTFNMTIPRNLVQTAGELNTGTGTVIFNGATTTIVSGNFYNLTLNNSSQVATITNNTIVNNTLTTTALATINGSPIEAKGNLVFTDTSWNGSSKIIVNGTGTQTNTGAGVCGVILDINKASGTFNLGANLTLLGTTVDLNLVGGSVNANTFNITIPRNLVKTAGVLNTGTGTVIFNGATTAIVSGNFYNLTLNNSSQVATITNNTIVNNTFTTTALATINGSPIEAKGNLVLTDTSWNGSSKLILNGTGVQTKTGAGVCGVTLEVNKASGSFDLGANFALLGTTVDLNLIAGTINCNTFTLTVPRNFTQSAGVFNGGTNTNTISGALTVNAGSFNATTGNLAMTNGAITLATGSFNANGGTITATGSTSRTYTLNNNTLNNLTLASTTGSTVVTFANPFTVAGNFIYTLATLNLTTGTITITGNLSARGLSTGTANYTFSGTGNQTIDCNGTTGNIGSVTINKTGGVLTVSNTPIFIKNFTYIAGSVDWGTAIAKFGRVSTTVSPVITSNGLIYNNVEILTGTADTMTLTGDMIVNGNFNMNVANIINGSKFRLRGNITTADTAITGTASTIIDGSGNQNIGGAGTLPGNGSNEIVVNKPSGTLNLTSNLSLSNTGQDLRIVDGDLALNGFNLTVRDNFKVFDKLTLKGSETITVNLLTTPAITNPLFTISGTSSTIEYTDSTVVANITKLSKTFNNLNLGAGKTHEVATGVGNGITINGIFASNGSAANRSVLRSLANASSTWQLNLVGTSALADKVDVKYSDASLGAAILASDSIDNGNNTNWVFNQSVFVANVSSELVDGAYKQGDIIQINITFSDVVVVTGAPTLTLETGDIDRIATFLSGSNTNTLLFSYTVQVGDTSADLDYVNNMSLTLNGGTIKSLDNYNANLLLPTSGAPNSLSANKNLNIYTFSATAQSQILVEDSNKSITLASNYVGANTITYSIVTPPAHGSLALVSGSTYTYTPVANYNGADSFVFKANDGADSVSATVSLTITPVNDAPVAIADAVTTDENTAITFSPVNNDTDIEGNTLTITATTNGTKGSATFSGNNVTYTPNLNANGTDTISYTISDGNGGLAIGSIAITILAPDAPPVVLAIINLEALKNKSFSFDLARHIVDEDKNSLLYELQYQPLGMSISSSGVIEMTNVGGALLTYDFFVKATDNHQNEVITNIKIDVVENLLNPNVVVQLNNSAITITASGVGDTPFVLMQTKLLATSGHDAEWLEIEYDHTNFLTYYGITNIADLPSKITVTIAPTEEFHSQNIVKAGIGLLNANGVFSKLYETTDLTFTSSYNRYVMYVSSSEIISSGASFSQGLNQIVMFTQLVNGTTFYYSGSKVVVPVAPYLRSVVDESRMHSTVDVNGQTKYEYNYLVGNANGLFIDTEGPEIEVLETVLANSKITIIGNLNDRVGTDFISATVSVKNGSNEFVDLDSNTYKITSTVSNGSFNLEIADKDTNNLAISTLSIGSQIKITLLTKDFLNNESNKNIELDYSPLDRLVEINSLSATSNGNESVLVSYQATILSSNYELDEVRINNELTSTVLAGTVVKSALEGKNYYQLAVKIKNTINQAQTFTVYKTVEYSLLSTVNIQNFIMSGVDNTYYSNLSNLGTANRQISFEITNPNAYALKIKIKLFNHFTQLSTDLNFVEYQPGKYRVTSEINLTKTIYDVSLTAISTNGLVSKSETRTFQNGDYALVATGPFSLEDPPSLSIVESTPQAHVVLVNGMQYLLGTQLSLNESGLLDISVDGFGFQAMVTPETNLPGIDLNGNESSSANYDTSKKAIEISYPKRPIGSFPTPIIKTTDQFLRGTVSSTFRSLMVLNSRNGKNREVTAELKPKGDDLYEFSAYLNFLEEGENSLVVKAIAADPAKSKSMIYTVIFDRNGPEVIISFGEAYDNVAVPEIFGYQSLFKTLIINGVNKTQDDYSFNIEIKDDYFLGKDISSITNNTVLSIGSNNINFSDLALILSPDNKSLTGTIKLDKKLFVSNKSGLYFARLESRDYIGNFAKKVKQFNFNRGEMVKLKLKPKLFNIFLPSIAPDYGVPAYLFTYAATASSLGSSDLATAVDVEDSSTEEGPCVKIVAGQEIETTLNLYEGGAVEQAALMANGLNVDFSVMVGNNNTHNPQYLFATAYFVIPPEGFPHMCPRQMPLEFADEIPNTEKFGMFFYKVPVTTKNYLQKIDDLINRRIAPTQAYIKIGRDTSVFPMEDVNGVVHEYKGFWPITQSLQEVDYPSPWQESFDPFQVVFPIQNTTDTPMFQHISIIEESIGYVENSSTDNVLITLLSSENLVGSNKFKELIEVDRSGEAPSTVVYHENNSIPHLAIVGNIFWDHLHTMPPLDPPPGFVPPWVSPELEGVDSYAIVDKGHIDQEYGLFKDNYQWAYIEQKFDACTRFNYIRRLYVQEEGDNDNKANIEYVLKLGEELPADIQLRYSEEVIWVDMYGAEPVAVYEYFVDFLSKENTPIQLGHYRPTDIVSYLYYDYYYYIKNKLDIYVEGITLLEASKEAPFEFQSAEKFIQPIFYDEFTFKISEIYCDEEGNLNFTQNIPDSFEMLDVLEFKSDLPREDLINTKALVVHRGENRFLISKIKYGGEEFPIYLDVLIGDGDYNIETTSDLFVENYRIQSQVKLPTLYLGQYENTKYNLLEYFRSESARSATVESFDTTANYGFEGYDYSWVSRPVYFITPSYYQLLTNEKFSPEANAKFLVAQPGTTVNINQSGYNELSPEVKGVVFNKANDSSPILELNFEDDFDISYFELISMNNGISSLIPTITTYDEKFEVVSTYTLPALKTYNEKNQDVGTSKSLDEFNSSQHFVEGASNYTLLKKIKFISQLAEASEPSNLDKNCFLAKDNGAVVIKIGNQTNIYRIHAHQSTQIEFEAITGITPRIGANSMSSSEFTTINDGSGSVFAHNKQFIHSQIDMTVAGRATSLSFVRTYRSGVETNSGLGGGWDHNFNKYFVIDKDKNLNWYQGNGRNDKIVKDGEDSFVMPPGFYYKIEIKDQDTEDVHYLVSYNNGSYEEYRQIDYRFKLTKIVDANDNVVVISWDKNSFIAYSDNIELLSFYSTAEAVGLSDGHRAVSYKVNRYLNEVNYDNRAFYFTYTPKGMLNGISTSNGSILTNNYSSVVGKEYQVTSQTANGITYTFADLAGGGVSETVSASGVDSLKTEYHMQSSDLSSQLSKYPKEIIYPGQTVEKVIYSDNQLDIFQIGTVTSRKGIASKTTFKTGTDVFSKGLVEKVEVLKAPGSDANTPNTISSSFTYLTRTIHENTIYLVSESIDARLNKTKFDYDDFGNVTKKSVESDAGYLDTFYQYDTYGRLQGSVGPNGATTANLYYDFVDPSLTISATGWLRRTISDGTVGAQNISKINALLAKDKADIRKNNTTLQITDFAYDAIGNTTTVVDTLGRASTTEYDSLRRVTKTTGPDFGNGRVSVNYLYEGLAPGGTDRGWNKWTTCTSEIPYPIITDSQSGKLDYGKKSLVVTREYNANGWLIKETANGQETIIALDAFGRVKANTIKGEANAPDQTTSLKYDGRGNIEKMIIGDNDEDASNGVSEDNSYTATSVENHFDASDNVDETSRNGIKVSKTIRDGLDRVVGGSDYTSNTKTERTLDLASNPVAVKAGKLNKSNDEMTATQIDMSMKIDKLGVATETTDNLRKNEAGQIEKAVSGMAYDIKKNEVKQFSPNFHNGSSFDESAAITSSSNNLIKTTSYPDGTVITTEFNVDGTVKNVTKDESGVAGTDGEIKKRRSRYEYDDNGFLIMDIVQEYDQGDKFKDPTTGIIAKNTYVNDGVGRKILVTDARGNQVKYDYNELGQLTTVVTGFGSNSAITKTMEYYKTGQLKKEIQGSQTTSYTYNSRGAVKEVKYVQDAKTEVESFEYNDKGLVKTKTLRHKEGDPAIVLTYKYEFEIDADNEGEDETDFLAQVLVGNKVIREYGDYTQNDVSFYELGQPKYAIEHNRFKANGAIDPSGDVVLTFEYNSSRQVIKETSYIFNMNGQLQAKDIQRHFDKAGQLKSLQYPSLVNSGLQYHYDMMNRLTSINNAQTNSSVKAFSYFGLGKVGVSSEGNGKIVQRFSYDKQDWLQSISGADGSFDAGNFTFKRENNGIKESVKYMINGLNEKTDNYKYDAQDRLISSDYTGKSLGQDIFNLDNLDNILSGKINGVSTTNVLKDAVRIDTTNGVAFKFDTRGNTIEDDKYKYAWDAFDRIRFIENKAVEPESFVNNRTFIDATITTSASEYAVTFNFNSDALPAITVDTLHLANELIDNDFVIEWKAFHTDSLEEWKAVPYNVTIDETNGTTSFQFGDIAVRQIRIREINANGTFALDNNSTYEFKDFVYPPGVWQKIEYLYDASGRRVQKIVDSKDGFWYLFDGYQMIEERTFNINNTYDTTLRRQVVYGTAINEPVYIFDAIADENYYLLKNDQNTVLALYKSSDTAGSAPREQYEYSSYGITNILDGSGIVKTTDHDLNPVTPEIKIIKSDFSNPFGYQGMWRDEHTGLYHTHYRLYDPQHVRWLTPDPAGYRDGQNLYRFYAGPNGVDVLGLDKLEKRRKKMKDKWVDYVYYIPETFGIDGTEIFVGIMDVGSNVIEYGNKRGLTIDYDKLYEFSEKWGPTGIKSESDFTNMIEGKDSNLVAPSLLVSVVPFVGSYQNAKYAAERGDLGGVAINSVFFVTDFFLVRSLITGVAKGLGLKLFTAEAQTSVKALGQIASNSEKALPLLLKADELAWKNLPLGVQIQEVAGYWIKRVNPNVSSFMKWWGELSINAQFNSLQKLKSMAPLSFLQNGMLFTKSVGETLGGGMLSRIYNLTVLKAFIRGSWRLKTPFNDIVGRNMGKNGLIFDPAFDSFSLNILGIFTTSGLKATIQHVSNEKGHEEE